MVSTRSGSTANVASVEVEDDRAIIVVTGANSGYGLGICQQLLSNLSLPPGQVPPAAQPQATALPRSQRHLAGSEPSSSASSTKSKNGKNPQTFSGLTLILACRSEQNAKEARETLIQTHKKELELRRQEGLEIRDGWLESLEIVYELADLSMPGGPKGILAFCERLESKYSYITSLYLNAAFATASYVHFGKFLKQLFSDGFVETVTDPKYVPEKEGVMTADGERGLVWSVNVLSIYIMIRELESMVRRSPEHIGIPSRIVISSSFTAAMHLLRPDPLEDYQLLRYGGSDSPYKASKYMSDIIAVQFDREFNQNLKKGQRSLRVLTADPGCMNSNIYVSAFTSWTVIRAVFSFFYSLVFHVAQLLGSGKHVILATNGALAMLYAALIDDTYLQPASKVPAQKFCARLSRRTGMRIEYGEVDRWEESLDLGEDLMKACEVIRAEWRRKEGLE